MLSKKTTIDHTLLIKEGDSKDKEQDRRLLKFEEKNKSQDERLDLGDKKDKEQDKRLDIGDKKDFEQDERLKMNEAKNVELDNRLFNSEERDKEQDKKLEELSDTIEKCQIQIASLQAILRNNDGLILNEDDKNNLNEGVKFLDEKIFDIRNTYENQQTELNKLNDELIKQNESLEKQMHTIKNNSVKHYVFEAFCLVLVLGTLAAFIISLLI